MKRSGWFDGERSVAEQLLGLEEAFAEAEGKTVLDLGCAEGAIAFAFARAGALGVDALDNNRVFVNACEMQAGLHGRGRVKVAYADLNNPLPAVLRHARYDIVLALAIVHKLHQPEAKLAEFAARCGDLLVLRLPGGSEGEFKAKHNGAICNTLLVMARAGFLLERVARGPRGERVQYWRSHASAAERLAA